MIELDTHQKMAVEKLSSGKILVGGVGSGKTRTSLAYYFTKVCGGSVNPFRERTHPIDLYVITTAQNRDKKQWEKEALPFLLYDDIHVDSWNNIKKYVDVENAFFIFDEQRVVGSGAWVKAFLKITKNNKWILLSATPGDTWMDYIPVFIANGYYKNRTEFLRRHVIFNQYTKWPQVDRYVETDRLMRIKEKILVTMKYTKKTTRHEEYISCPYDGAAVKYIAKHQWNIYDDEPIENPAQFCYLIRRVVNSDLRRLEEVEKILKQYDKAIIFYNYNYELDLLKTLTCVEEITEWNGHVHQSIPNSNSWAHLVQYAAGAEGWNCIETNCMIFYSLNYSYKQMIQAAGRIDRMNTTYQDLYYYYLKTDCLIDKAIERSLKEKKDFNEAKYVKEVFPGIDFSKK